jgi:hypothetical protein
LKSLLPKKDHMGLFTNLFAPKVKEEPSSSREVVVLIGAAKFEVEVRVEDHDQPAIEAICGPRRSQGVNRFETARLLLEDKNPYDKNAVRVEIRGKTVGYLNPEEAVSCREQLSARGAPHGIGQCQALIRGGWLSSDGREGPYEVWLDLPTWWQ